MSGYSFLYTFNYMPLARLSAPAKVGKIPARLRCILLFENMDIFWKGSLPLSHRNCRPQTLRAFAEKKRGELAKNMIGFIKKSCYEVSKMPRSKWNLGCHILRPRKMQPAAYNSAHFFKCKFVYDLGRDSQKLVLANNTTLHAANI